MTEPDDLHDLLDRVLTRTVRRITGDQEARPRPGQAALSHDILTAMIGYGYGKERALGHVLGCAPTGVGKAIACAAPAAVMAVARKERSVMSTESIALQSQLIGKDLPDVASAIAIEMPDAPELTFAVRKGWSNYGCPAAAISTLRTKLEEANLKDTVPEPSETDPELVIDAALKAAQNATAVDTDLIEWVLVESIANGFGDKATCTTDVRAWHEVSVGPTECAGTGEKGCPLASVCPAVRGRDEANAAQIVITNHAMLAVQAATGAPVLLGNSQLGLFRHLIVDEAHALPGMVRNSGSRELSARAVSRAARLLARNFGSIGAIQVKQIDRLETEGQVLADTVDATLLRWFNRQDGDTPALPECNQDHPVDELYGALVRWVSDAKRALPSEHRLNTHETMKRARVYAALSGLVDDASELLDYETPAARWVERSVFLSDAEKRRGWSGATAKMSPVDVSDKIAGGLFTTVERVPGEKRKPKDEEVRLSLSVTMVSATLPSGFAMETGISAKPVDYPSPFAQAYGDSLLYVPRVDDPAELRRIATPGANGRWKFDVYRHPEWAAAQIVDLVKANGGSALVLSAKADTGRLYADRLRAMTNLTVYSQWDGGDATQIAAAWKADAHAVLVGTKSFMTGLDAAGDTCSLVIVDRVPRAPGNVVDDARAAAIGERAGLDKWATERLVYGADATLLMEQAAGRLVRRVTDTGLVAILDPRLMKNAPLSYPESTRAMYMRAGRAFPVRTSDKQRALDYLSKQHANRKSKVAA